MRYCMLGCENCNISVNKGKYHVRFHPCDYKYFQKSALRYQHSTRSKITYYCCHFVTYTYYFQFYVKLRFLLLGNMSCGILWHTCFLHPQVSLTQASSSPKQILGFFPGMPSLSFVGARLFTLWKGGQIPLPYIHHSNLCLTTAILHAFSLTSPISTVKHSTWLKPPHQACRFFLLVYFSKTHMSIILRIKLHQACFFVMTTHILSLATIL